MIDWSRIDAVLLDMDGTLIDLRFDNHLWNVVVSDRYGRRNLRPERTQRTGAALGRFQAVKDSRLRGRIPAWDASLACGELGGMRIGPLASQTTEVSGRWIRSCRGAARRRLEASL